MKVDLPAPFGPVTSQWCRAGQEIPAQIDERGGGRGRRRRGGRRSAAAVPSAARYDARAANRLHRPTAGPVPDRVGPVTVRAEVSATSCVGTIAPLSSTIRSADGGPAGRRHDAWPSPASAAGREPVQQREQPRAGAVVQPSQTSSRQSTRIGDQRTGQQDAALLAARKLRERPVGETTCAGAEQAFLHLPPPPSGERSVAEDETVAEAGRDDGARRRAGAGRDDGPGFRAPRGGSARARSAASCSTPHPAGIRAAASHCRRPPPEPDESGPGTRPAILAGDQPEQRRLAGTVAAEDGEVPARREVEVDVTQGPPPPVAHGHAAEPDQRPVDQRRGDQRGIAQRRVGGHPSAAGGRVTRRRPAVHAAGSFRRSTWAGCRGTRSGAAPCRARPPRGNTHAPRPR